MIKLTLDFPESGHWIKAAVRDIQRRKRTFISTWTRIRADKIGGKVIIKSKSSHLPRNRVRISSVSYMILLLFAPTAHGDVSSDLTKAATEGQTETLKALISRGADIESDGGSALISAAFSALDRYEKAESNEGQIQAVQILVDAGADVEAQIDNGITALMLMAILGQTEPVRVLLEAGADVNATNNADGGTALIFAVYGGSTETVSALIEAGADLSVTDAGTGSGDGRTALDYAKEKNHAEITEVLKQAGAK